MVTPNTTVIVSGQNPANMPPENIPMAPVPFEGGEYSVNTWVYVSSYNTNRNTRKHVLEIKGEYFSTLLIALGAFKNTLTVRTHSDEIVEAFQSSGGSGSDTSDSSDSSDTNPPNVGSSGSLSSSDIESLFAPMAMDDSTLTGAVTCDLPEIDLQRWTMITVVLSGRTIDVYIDGKLSRSCVSTSYYKVDPTGVKMNILDRGGFDGYIGTTTAANHSMNPDEIYRTYLAGPEGNSTSIFSWIKSFFTGKP